MEPIAARSPSAAAALSSSSTHVYAAQHFIDELRLWDVVQVLDDPKRAIAVSEPILSWGRSAQQPRVTAHALLVLGGANAFRGDLEVAERQLGEAERLFREHGDVWGELSAILRQNIIWGCHEQMDISLSRLPAILERARVLDEPRLLIGILNDLGLRLRDNLQVERGLAYSIEAHERAEALGDRSYVLLTKVNLLDPLMALGDFEAVREFCEDCLDLLDTTETVLRFEVYLGLGACDLNDGQGESALAFFAAAAEIAAQGEDPFSVGVAHFESGRALAVLGSQDRAVEAFQDAHDTWLTMPGMDHTARVVLARWSIESLTESWQPQTLELMSEAIARSDSEPLFVMEQLYDAAVESSEHLGDLALALRYAREGRAKHESYWRSLASHTSHRLAKELQTDSARRIAQRERQHRKEVSARFEEHEELVEDLRSQSAALTQLAWQDGLTGVANRRHFDVRYAAEFEQSAPLSIALLDIDDFKTINDRFSHLVGDDVLRAMGIILQKSCRPRDIVARYGGEEFAIILPDTMGDTAQRIAERMRTEVQQYYWSDIADGLAVTVSIGLVTVPADAIRSHLETAFSVLTRVDEQLYRAKQSGKNVVAVGSLIEQSGE